MSRLRFITFQGTFSNEEIDIELPGDLTVGVLLPDLLKTLNWPTTDGDQELVYQLQTEDGQVLSENKTLIESGIENSEVLRISLMDNQELDPDLSHQTDGLASLEPSPQDRRGSLTPPQRIQIPITQPSLVSETGYIFVLGEPPIQIGRRSQNHIPDIDLFEIDTEMIASRQHAEILQSNGQFMLKPLSTTNGTFVNGVEVSTGESIPIKNCDVIQFGFNKGVKLTFRQP